MGFPKPWPTDWPEPDSAGDDDPDWTGDGDDEQPASLPEFRRFYSVTWAINHACNLRCTHCYDVVPFARRDLPTADALRLIDRLDEAGVTFIAFSGGEAFLRKDVLELMGRCAERGMQFGARSNGTRISEALARELRALGIGVVGVSFDGATPATHDAVRGPGGFAAALAGLRALVGQGIRAQIEVVLSRANLHEAEAFIELGATVGAAEVNFSAITPQGRGRQRREDLLDHGDWRRVTAALRGASRSASLPVTPNCALLGACHANIEPHVTCDGWMTPCYLSHEKLFSVLETPPEQIRALLERSRPAYRDVCGRAAWTRRS